MKVTVITMWRGRDCEIFVAVVEGVLTDEEKKAWRQSHKCDEFYTDKVEDENYMHFGVRDVLKSKEPSTLTNASEDV
jgi:hypothetical protein